MAEYDYDSWDSCSPNPNSLDNFSTLTWKVDVVVYRRNSRSARANQ